MFGAKTDTLVCMQISFDDDMAEAIDKMVYENERESPTMAMAARHCSLQALNQ